MACQNKVDNFEPDPEKQISMKFEPEYLSFPLKQILLKPLSAK